MFDFEQLVKGYSKEDEFIARDLLLLELLVEKGVITNEEINEKYKHLEEKIKSVKKQRRESIEERVKELRGRENE